MDTRQFIDLLFGLTFKEFKARYKVAILGFLWMFLNPLFQMLVIGFIFSFFFKFPVENYYLFLIVGLLPWQYFSQSLTDGTKCLVSGRDLIKKAKFPNLAIPASVVLTNAVNFFIALFLILVLLFITGRASLGIFFLPLVFVWQTAVILGLTLFTSALNPRYRDVSFLVQALIVIWFYATPIIYPLKVIPQSLLPLFWLNPMTAIVTAYRLTLLGNSDLAIPVSFYAFHLVLTLAIFWFGFKVYQHRSHNFADWL